VDPIFAGSAPQHSGDVPLKAMRELLLIAVVVPLCVVALFRPRIGLYAYIWFALMRPDVLAWSNGRYPYSLSLAVCTLIGSLVYLPRFRAWFTNPIAAGMLLLQVPMVLSVLFAVNPALCYEPYYFYLRVVLAALLIVVFVTTEEDLRHLFLVIALSLGAIGAKFGFWALLRGGARYSSGYPDSMMSDNNTLALGLAMVLPLCWYGVQMTAARSLKALLILFGFGSVAAVVMTHSRGGALCAGAGLLLMALRSKRRIAALLWICILAAPAVYVVKDSYVERLESTTDTADASIQSRNAHRAAAVRMWKDYPWFGVGYGTGNYVALISNYLGYEDSHVAHHQLSTILSESAS
jgi:putative inorganic carbon (HCO3(-)) transporter